MERWAGVDLHKRKMSVCWLWDDGKREEAEYQLDKKGIAEFKSRLNAGVEVAIEATGNSGYITDEIREKVKAVRLINPRQFKVISDSVKKTDRKDAETIAEYLSKGLIPEVRQMSSEQRQLRSLINTRDKLVKLRSALKNKIHGIMNEHGIITEREMFSSEVSYERIQKMPIGETARFELGVIIEQIHSLGKTIKGIDEKIKEQGKNLPGQKNLTSITGIGELSSAIILNGIGDIKDFDDPKKLCAYAGMVPRVRDTGDNIHHGHITKRGNKILRTTVVQSTLIAIKYNDYLRKFYFRLKQKKGSGKAIIATSRKMLEIIYNTLKNDWVFKDFNNFEIAN